MTSLTVVTAGATPLMAIDLNNISYDVVQEYVDQELASRSIFPGDVHRFDGKKGRWYIGWGKNSPEFEHLKHSLILNIPHMIEVYETFVDGRPVILATAMPFAGQKLPDRKSMGMTDPAQWEISKLSGKPEDPIKRSLVIPFRYDGGAGADKVHHIKLTTATAILEFKHWMKAHYLPQARAQGSRLPVVNLGAYTAENAEGQTYEVPQFEIVDWENPTQADFIKFGDDEGAQQIAQQTAVADPNAALPPPEARVTRRDELNDPVNFTGAGDPNLNQPAKPDMDYNEIRGRRGGPSRTALATPPGAGTSSRRRGA